MKDVRLDTKIPITLQAWEWFWIIGLLTSVSGPNENDALDRLYAQIMEAVE